MKTATPSLPSRLTILLLLAALLGTTAAITASPAEATTTPGVNATPHNDGGHWWAHDGCSWVPDRGWHRGSRFDFHHACKHHDGGYRHHWASRATVDRWFLNDMRASCRASNPWWRRSGCYRKAWLYYAGVRAGGHGAYVSRSINGSAMSRYA